MKLKIVMLVIAQLLLVASLLYRGASVWLSLQVSGAIIVGSLIGWALAVALDRYGVVTIS